MKLMYKSIKKLFQEMKEKATLTLDKNNGVAKTLKMLRTSKGDYWIKQ